MNGMLFRPELVAKVINGTKTETRRADQLKEINTAPDEWVCQGMAYYGPFCGRFIFGHEGEQRDVAIRPHYYVWETVYIKEMYALPACYDGDCPNDAYANATKYGHGMLVWYPDTPYSGVDQSKVTAPCDGSYSRLERGKFRTPMMMPARAARLFRQIDGVEAQRLLSITPEQVYAEGIANCRTTDYLALWDSINPTMPSKTNPWLFRYTFHKVDKPLPNQVR